MGAYLIVERSVILDTPTRAKSKSHGFDKLPMLLMSECLGEYVSYHVIGRYITNISLLLGHNIVSDEMVLPCNVFGASTELRVL